MRNYGHPFQVKGITFVEIIITLAVLGAVVLPLMNLFVMSSRLNQDSDKEYKSIVAAQRYMEEIMAEEIIDTEKYKYNPNLGSYSRNIIQKDNEFGVEIKITLLEKFLYSIEVTIKDKGEVVNSLNGTKIIH